MLNRIAGHPNNRRSPVVVAEASARSAYDAAMNPDSLHLAILIARLAVGVTMAYHGWKKVKGGLPNTARWFESIGMKPGKLHAPLAAYTEIGGGALLALGFLTPLAAASIVSLMVVAIWTAHRKNGFFILNPGQGWEYCFILATFALLLGTIGAGRWSLDNAFDIEWSGWSGFLISAVLGVGAGAGLMAAFYRPPAKA